MMACIFSGLMPGVFSRREVISLSSCSLVLSSGTFKASIQEPFSECQLIKKDRAGGGRVFSPFLLLLCAHFQLNVCQVLKGIVEIHYLTKKLDDQEVNLRMFSYLLNRMSNRTSKALST